MKMQTSIIFSVLCCSTFGIAHAADFEDYGRVLRVAPQVEQVNVPQQECRTEYVPVQRQQSRNVGGTIIGGLAGGLLGNQIGGGNGKTAATAVGAVTGAIVGDRLDNNNGNNNSVATEPVRQCRTVEHWESRTNGYAVTYDYHGRTYTSVMPYDPGQRIRLNVSLTPR
jgi:uncharacterized protein YcfJ